MKGTSLAKARFVDDFIVGCNSRNEAEKILSIIRRSANNSELEINTSKTIIKNTDSLYVTGWRGMLRRLITDKMSKDDLEILFYNTNKVSLDYPTLNVEKFVVQNARRAFIKCSDWQTVEQYLLSLYRHNPTIVSNMVEIFILRDKARADLDKQIISQFVNARLPTLCEQQKNGEAIWLLFLALQLNLTVRRRAVEGFFTEEDALIAFLILDANGKHLVMGKIDTQVWDKSLIHDGLDSNMWFYSYEVARRNPGGLHSVSHVHGHRYFSQLYKCGVDFYRDGPDIYDVDVLLRSKRRENMATQQVIDSMGDLDHSDIDFHFDEIDEDNLEEDLEY